MGSREGLVTATPSVLGSPSSSRMLPSRRPTGPGILPRSRRRAERLTRVPSFFLLPPPGSVACPRGERIVHRCH